MKNSQKGFVVPLLIGIVAVLVVGGGIYVYNNRKVEAPAVVQTETETSEQVQQQKNTQTPSSTTSKSETANWVTYSNTQYGFEFWYPRGWENCLNNSKGDWPRSDHPKGSEMFCVISDKPQGPLEIKPILAGFVRSDLRTKYPSYNTLLKYLNDQVNLSNSTGAGGLAWVNEVKIGNKNAIDDCFGDADWSCTRYFFTDSNLIAVSYTDSPEEVDSLITTKIFLTFKFTN